MSDSHTDKVAVVAGGGSGIGRGCALRFAGMGYKTILLGRDVEKLSKVAAEIAATGGDVETFAADVRDWDRLAELGDRLAATGIDVLVNSAGGQTAQPSAEMSREHWENVVGINLHGSFYLCRHLYKALRKRQGCVVTVVANMWQMPAPGLAHSAAARAGVVNLTRTLAKEWAPDRIRLNAVAPGLTDSGALRPEYKALVDRVPLGRIGTVDDVVDTIVFLAGASYITGEVISVDGGIRLA
ncbi:MAG TPA: SDR family oxidoreductase [Spongiibacteraceae bacterium]|nr:SDR family oxidoreductase [Spongiibacteraceae bacterium]